MKTNIIANSSLLAKVFLIAATLFWSEAFSAPAPPPVIQSITSKVNVSGLIVNGRWTGQPSAANLSPTGYTDIGKNFWCVESKSTVNPTIVTISGSFGYTGSVWLLNGFTLKPVSGASAVVTRWTPSAIYVTLKGSTNFTTMDAALLVVSLDQTAPTTLNNTRMAYKQFPIIGTINSVGWGQCSWEALGQRANAGLVVPDNAYVVTKPIASVGGASTGYAPRKYDILNFNWKHVAIITSNPVFVQNTDGTQQWTFQLTERNYDWKQSVIQTTQVYKLSKPDSKGVRSVLTGIGCKAYDPKKTVATGAYQR